MTAKAEGVLEILVHTAAPSGGKDDAHYRALAKAYLLFEPVHRLSLCDISENDHFTALDESVGGQLRAVLLQSTPEDVQAGSKENIGYDGEDSTYELSQPQAQIPSKGYTTSPNIDRRFSLDPLQMSFNSVLDNMNSPPLRCSTPPLNSPSLSARHEPHPSIGNNEGDEGSWHTPPSVIPDSQSPCNRAIPEFSSPTRVLELYLQHFDTPESPSAAGDPPGNSQAYNISSSLFLYSSQSETAPAQEITPVLSTATEEPLDLIRDSPYAAPCEKSCVSCPSKRRYSLSPKADVLSSNIYEPSVTKSHPYHVPPVEPAKQLTQSSASSITQTSPLQKRRKVDVSSTRTKQIHRMSSRRTSKPRITANEIHPPLPLTSSTGPLPSLITPALQLLAIQLSLTTRYRPKSQTRPLRELERGFWSVSMTAWPEVVREQAWTALSAYLGQGKAGWGVWCLRCGSGNHTHGKEGQVSDEHPEGLGVAVKDGEPVTLRIYCWGGVVGHIYLLLYLVSQRRVKGAGIGWYDGGGGMVILMP